MGRASGLRRFPKCGRRQDDDQRGDIRGVPAPAKRPRRRPCAPANEADRAAYQACRADRKNVRVQGRRKSRPSSIRSMGLVRACIWSMRTGRLIHANAAGNAILGASDILSSVGGRLVASDAHIDRALRDVFAAAGQGDAALGTKGIAVPLIGKDGERYIAHALPLTSGARRSAGIVNTAAAASIRPQGDLGGIFRASSHRQRLQADADRASRIAGDCRGWRHSGSRRSIRHRRHDGQNPCQPSVRKDRHLASGRSRQARGRICDAAG